VIIVDRGAIRYQLDRHDYGSETGTVTLLPPGVVHDGQPATEAGFRKRVLYVQPEVLAPSISIGKAVDEPRIRDGADLYRTVARLHTTLQGRDDHIAGEAQLAAIVEQLGARVGRGPAQPRPTDPSLADRLRQLLDAHMFEPVTLAQAGRILGANTTHLVRSFTRAFGVSPHAYVVGRRVDEARRLLLDGRPAATVAVEVGFHDQAHLSRHFKRHVGTSPGRFVNQR
jgi:AraC-like DNA-binding protein